jgi:histone H3/H4
MAQEFTITPMRRLLKKAGDLRISEEAAEELRNIIGDLGTQLASYAVQNALNEGRKTILERDIKVALEKLLDTGV